MQMVVLVWGIVALVGMFIAFFPCLGALNWLNIPFSASGLIVGIIVLATSTEQNKGPATAGTICCAVATVLGFLRLIAGGGVF